MALTVITKILMLLQSKILKLNSRNELLKVSFFIMHINVYVRLSAPFFLNKCRVFLCLTYRRANSVQVKLDKKVNKSGLSLSKNGANSSTRKRFLAPYSSLSLFPSLYFLRYTREKIAVVKFLEVQI